MPRGIFALAKKLQIFEEISVAVVVDELCATRVLSFAYAYRCLQAIVQPCSRTTYGDEQHSTACSRSSFNFHALSQEGR